MSSIENREAEKTKRAARFEAKVLRKRFLFCTAKRQDRRFDREAVVFPSNAIDSMTRRLAHDIQVTERDVKWRHLVADQDTKLSKN